MMQEGLTTAFDATARHITEPHVIDPCHAPGALTAVLTAPLAPPEAARVWALGGRNKRYPPERGRVL